MSHWLWRYDRGEHLRSQENLKAYIEEYFTIETEANLTMHNNYVVFIARPTS